MIYFFSGTGNSRKTAETLGGLIDEPIREIPSVSPFYEEGEGEALGFVCPVYSWGIPPIVLDFIDQLSERAIEYYSSSGKPVWVLLTYGDEAGDALSMLKDHLSFRGLKLAGAWGIQMPNVYVLLPGFDVDSKELASEKLKNAEKRIKQIAGLIHKGQWTTDVYKGSLPWLKTHAVYPLFKWWGINAKKWKVSDRCVGCAKCERICPVKNIAMAEGKPHWGNECTSCCGCYHVCPVKAISYGNVTKNKGQFQPKGK